MDEYEESKLLDRQLYRTPTWAVAIVCSAFVIVSLAAQRSIRSLGNWLKKTSRKPLFHSLEKIRDELMVLGFISLILTLTQTWISSICVDSKLYDKQPTPCRREDYEVGSRHFLRIKRRLDALSYGSSCLHKGKEPFVSYESLEQLHWFIFTLGITHVVYSCLTLLLSLIKIYSWSSWEMEAHLENHDSLAEITKNLQSTYVLYHTSRPWSKNRFYVWVDCCFRQFGRSVTKADYLTLRLGFISNHGTRLSYNFHRYLIRTIEDEFQKIVGISEPLWIFVIMFMLTNVQGLNLYFWFAFVPVVLLIVVGAKLQHVIATLALENAGICGHLGHSFMHGDGLFWFNKPELLLNLMHFILFQNAFELASFFWTLGQFGHGSCLIADQSFYVYTRLISGLLAQLLCSYSTLPLYALVTQMGSNYKKTIFQESIMHSLNAWRKTAQQKASTRKVQKVLKRSGYSSVGREETENPC